jgi:hypothetical protein
MIEKPTEPNFILSLDVLASKGSRWLWKSHLRDGLWARASKGMALLLVMPVMAIAITMLGWIVGQPWKLSFGLFVSLFPLPTLLYLGYYFVQIWQKKPSRREGLAVFDEALDLKDRLQTADEFLTVADPTPFMEAAIEDAGPALEKAIQRPLDWDWRKPWGEFRHVAMIPMLAIVLLLFGIFLPAFPDILSSTEQPVRTQIALAGNLPLSPEGKPPTTVQKSMNTPRPKKERPEEHIRKGMKGEPSPAKINETPSSWLPGRDKISLGISEGGQTSKATSSGCASQSRGMPGGQAPSSIPDHKPIIKNNKNKKLKEQKTSETQRKQVEDKSGATAGRGSSSGSSRNPASTEWSTKDRTDTTDNEDFEQEEDVNDEESGSEARGGLELNLRDRRPPVNRDLSIGFGNRASQDSNGRGGPGDRKKSRGVASMVLGVPVPDQVKGQPNPGRVKVHQERVQPQGEDVPKGAAEDRGRRRSLVGHLSERTLDMSMRYIVREFFLKTRASGAHSTQNETSNE